MRAQLSFVLPQITCLTDRILIARPRLHSMQRSKNYLTILHFTKSSTGSVCPLVTTQAEYRPLLTDDL